MSDYQIEVSAIRTEAKASHFELQINRATTRNQCSKLVIDWHTLALQKAEDFIRARFWVGGAVHKAHSLAKSGDNIMNDLSQSVGINETLLSNCMRLYDLCSGKIERLQSIIDNVLEVNGKLGWGDIETILRVNKKVIQENKKRRIVQDRIEEIHKEAPGAQVIPLNASDEDIIIPDFSPDPVKSRITKRKTLRSIASACNELATNQGGQIAIQEIEIEGEGSFTVLVSIVPIAVS